MNRKIKPRPAMVVRPSFVSNETCFVVFGLISRKFLEIVVPKCERVSRIGKTVLVELDEAERVIRKLAADAEAEPAVRDDDEDQPTTAAGVLSRLGLERVPS